MNRSKRRAENEALEIDALDQRIEGIKSKLRQARECGALKPKQFRQLFNENGSLLNPTSTEQRIKNLESQLRIRLPADYKRFLLVAGDGGAGPYEGLLPAPLYDAGIRIKTPPIDVRHPCTSVSLCVLPFCCGTSCGEAQWLWSMLALEGTMAGRVYYLGMGQQKENAILLIDHPDFISWYEAWLDLVLSHADTSYYGFDPPPYFHEPCRRALHLHKRNT